MGELSGLSEYLEKTYEKSVFDMVLASGKPWMFHLHGNNSLRASIRENSKWEVTMEIEGEIEGKGREDIQKIQIKYLYPADLDESVRPLIKRDQKVATQNLEPIFAPGLRHFVKNKSLFPLMKEREVLFFTLLEGEIIKGIVTDFSRYDVTVSMKGGLPVTILRHSIYNLTNKKGRSFLKTFQERYRDWENSPLFIPDSDSEDKNRKGGGPS